MQDISNLININERKGFPRKYKFRQGMRWFTLILGILVVSYSVWMIFTKIYSDSSNLIKYIPFAILFLALNSVIKNLFSLNSILFEMDKISFQFIGKKAVRIKWQTIKKLELNDAKRKMIRIVYESENGDKTFEFPIIFPNMLEIVNSIVEMTPNAELDEFIGNVVISDKEKNTILKK